MTAAIMRAMASHYYEHLNGSRQENAVGVDFKDVNKKVPALFSALNTPLFNIDKRNAAVRDLYEEIDQVVPLGWKFVAAVIFPSGEILFRAENIAGTFLLTSLKPFLEFNIPPLINGWNIELEER